MLYSCMFTNIRVSEGSVQGRAEHCTNYSHVLPQVVLLQCFRYWKIGVTTVIAAIAVSVSATGGVAYHYNYTPINRR